MLYLSAHVTTTSKRHQYHFSPVGIESWVGKAPLNGFESLSLAYCRWLNPKLKLALKPSLPTDLFRPAKWPPSCSDPPEQFIDCEKCRFCWHFRWNINFSQEIMHSLTFELRRFPPSTLNQGMQIFDIGLKNAKSIHTEWMQWLTNTEWVWFGCLYGSACEWCECTCANQQDFYFQIRQLHQLAILAALRWISYLGTTYCLYCQSRQSKLDEAIFHHPIPVELSRSVRIFTAIIYFKIRHGVDKEDTLPRLKRNWVQPNENGTN